MTGLDPLRCGTPRDGGFTIPEILVALVLLTVVAVSLAATTQYAARIVNRSSMELAAQQFLEGESERLRLTPYDSLRDGRRSEGRGIATWRVQDSTTFRQVLLETRFGTPAQGLLVDSVILFRTP